jgi:hypothetical protein
MIAAAGGGMVAPMHGSIHALRSNSAAGHVSLVERLDDRDWPAIAAALDGQGFALLPCLFTPAECAGFAGRYDDAAQFRSRVVMDRHGFGRGEYQYFAYPLPRAIQSLRSRLYDRLAPIARDWNRRSGREQQFPGTHDEFLAHCHAAGQLRPTPLLLRYGPGDFNCLHQDLYGEQVFPMQLAVLLSEPGADFTGGEFVLTEQRPRQQSRVEVVPLEQGDAVVFAVNERPVQGSRGVYRVRTRHGVSRIRSGQRHTLGIILHDAA